MPAMDESTRWGSERYLTLFLVVAVHAGLLAWLSTMFFAPSAAGDRSESVHLIYLPPQSLPKIRIVSPQPWRLRRGIPLSPPLLAGISAPSPEAAAPSGASAGGSGVDWAAEERRALQAYEIRTHHPEAALSVSRRSPAEQPWWPAHRPGERYKTADGNWIVWIDSSCYQVATSSPAINGSGPQPRTICPDMNSGDGSAPEPAAGSAH
jgi:hypothetical protein